MTAELTAPINERNIQPCAQTMAKELTTNGETVTQTISKYNELETDSRTIKGMLFFFSVLDESFCHSIKHLSYESLEQGVSKLAPC